MVSASILQPGRDVLEVVVDALVRWGLGLRAVLQDKGDTSKPNQFVNRKPTGVAANKKTGRVMRFDTNTFDPLRPHDRMRNRSANDVVIKVFLATGGEAGREHNAINELQENRSG